MPTQGPFAAGTGVEVDASGFTWTAPEEATALDGVNATVTDMTGASVSNLIVVSDFGFSLPGDAVIDGLELSIFRKASTDSINNNAYIHDVQVVMAPDGSTAAGDNNADVPAHWPVTTTEKVYGDPTDLWGLTPTAAELNSSDWSVIIQCGCVQTIFLPFPPGPNDAFIDSVQLKVYFNGGQTYTSEATLTLPAIQAVAGGDTEATLYSTHTARFQLPAIEFAGVGTSGKPNGVNLTRWLEDESFALGVL